MQPAPENAAVVVNASSMPAPGASAGTDGLFRKLFLFIPLCFIVTGAFSLALQGRSSLPSLEHLAPGYLALALMLAVVPWFTGSLRQFIWARFLGRRVRYRDMFRIAVGAELGAAVSPSLVGGSPVKVWMLMQQGFTAGAALSLTMLEGFEDAAFFAVMVPLALTLSAAWGLPVIRHVAEGFGNPSLWLPAAGTAAVLGVVMISMRRLLGRIVLRFAVVRRIAERIASAFRQCLDTFRTIVRRGRIVFVLTMTLTAIQWICRYSIVSVVLLSLGIPCRPLLFMALQVIVFGVMALVPTPGGSGGAEAMFYLVYRTFLPVGIIGVAVAVWRFFTFYVLLILASVIFVATGLRIRKAGPEAAGDVLSGQQTVEPGKESMPL